MKPFLLTKTEACTLLGFGSTKLHELIRCQAIDLVYVGRKSSRTTTDSIDRYVKSLHVGMNDTNREAMQRLVHGL